MYNYIGKSEPRRDGYEKVTGVATFTHDVSLPNMLYAKVLRSPHAHARIISIDTSKALALPGVKAIATWENTPRKHFNTSATMTFTVEALEPVLDQYIFDNVVRYVGDEVAAVAATTEKIAEEACKLIKVEYELLPFVLDPIEAMKDNAPEIHPTTEGKNIPGEIIKLGMGNFEDGFKNSDVTVDVTVKVPIQKHAQMETHAAVALYKNNSLTVWSPTQTPHPTKQILAHIFDMSQCNVRVQNPPHVGGGFGVRIGLCAKAEPIATVLSKMTGQAVKIIYDRHEDFIASDTRHSGYVYAKIGAKKDGTFNALELRSILNTGAYCSFGTEVPGVLGAMGVSVYRVPNISYHGHSVYTNIVPAGAMRGFGNPQAMFAVEEAVDEIAKKLNMDPVELRLKNIMKKDDPWCLPYPCNSTGLAECIEKAAHSIGWKEKRAKTNKTGTIRRGVGIAVGTHVSNSWPFCVDYDSVYLRLEEDGSLVISTGAPNIGTGTTTSLAQIAAEITGIALENVNTVYADTASTPFDIGSHASRTLCAVGAVIIEAGKKLKEEVLQYIADAEKANVKDIRLEKSIVYINDKQTPLDKFIRLAHLRNKQFISTACQAPVNTPPWHAHAAEVEVDMETGMVRIIKVAAAHDVGKAINPVIVEGQIEGGVAMGIGYAIREEMTIDENGKAYNDGFHKYMLPTSGDMPIIDTIIVETLNDSGPFGAKGVGECGLVPTAPAIAAAVEDAIGIRFHQIPMTPVVVLKEISKLK